MPQFLFDTDHLTLYHHKHAPLMQRLALQPADAVAICPINIEETMRGRLAPLGRVLSGAVHVQAYANLVAAEEMFVCSRWCRSIAAAKTSFNSYAPPAYTLEPSTWKSRPLH
jgi:hypothetical protein